MDLAQTFSQLAAQLDRAIASFDDDTVSPQDAATLRLATTALQYQLDALSMKVETKIEADGSNIAFLNNPSREFHNEVLITDKPLQTAAPIYSDAVEAVANALAAEKSVFESAEFANGEPGPFDNSEPINSTWEDGTEFQWVGSQCVVRHTEVAAS